MQKIERPLSIAFMLLASSVICLFVFISSQRVLSSLENILLQFIIFIFSFTGSYFIGRQSAKNAAQEIIKPHARSAFRRLLSLFRSLSRVATVIEESNNKHTETDYAIILAKLQAIIIEQLATADDALEDWKDIVPEDVAELTKNLKSPFDKRTNNV